MAASRQSPGESLIQFIVDGFLSDGNNEPVDVAYFLIWVTIAINWDACLLLIATVFVRWNQLVRRSWMPLPRAARARPPQSRRGVHGAQPVKAPPPSHWAEPSRSADRRPGQREACCRTQADRRARKRAARAVP